MWIWGWYKDKLEDHELDEHNNTCASCLNVFRIPETYDSHICKHYCEQCSEGLFGCCVLKCDECDYTVCSESCMKDHLESSHISNYDYFESKMNNQNELDKHKEIKDTFTPTDNICNEE